MSGAVHQAADAVASEARWLETLAAVARVAHDADVTITFERDLKAVIEPAGVSAKVKKLVETELLRMGCAAGLAPKRRK